MEMQLEELVLTHNEIQGPAANEVAMASNALGNFRRLDLTRNHIPPKVMQEVCGVISQDYLSA